MSDVRPRGALPPHPPGRSLRLEIGGVALHVVDHGAESEGAAARPLLLLHGGMGHSRWWDLVAPPLTDVAHPYALDRRGHGDSDWADPDAYGWERDLLEMPAHVPAIVNWRLSRAIPLDWSKSAVPAWTHVWEQEYEQLEGLTVDYMVHPHHWAHVDRWFDPESGSQIIDTALCHAFSPMAGAVLTGDAR